MRMTTHPDRESWLEARRAGIGASDAAAVLGVYPWKSPFACYVEKVTAVPGQDESEAMRAGNVLEPVVADWFARETEYELDDPGRFTIVEHPLLPWALATIDRYIVSERVYPDEAGDAGVIQVFPPAGRGVLEVKTTGARNEERWDEEAPLWVQVQVQHQLAVTGLAWGYAAVLIGGQKFRMFRMERNERFIETMLEAEEKFWNRVKSRNAPPVDATEQTTDLLRRLYPTAEPGVIVDLSREMDEADAQLVGPARADIEKFDIDGIAERFGIRPALKVLEARERELTNRIRSAIGTAEKGMLPSGVVWTSKEIQREAYTVPASTYRNLTRKAPK